jgi:hypothetical protein
MAFTPTDPTKAEVRVVGTYPNQTLDFYFPSGPKGDPGGITLGTDLGTADINQIVTPGVYRLPSTQTGLLLRNFPRDTDTGILIVHNRTADSATATQEWQPIMNGTASIGRFIRTRNTSTWGPWKFIPVQRVDQTAGRAIYTWDDVNNREQIIYGDTGWRDVTSSILAPFTVNGLRLRRNLNRVTIQWDSLSSPPAAPSGSAFTAPAGFTVSNRDPSYFGRSTIQQAANSIGNLWSFGWNSASLIPQQCVGSWFSSLYFNGGFTYLTDDPWPTTLPGTAVGTIPNT